MSYTISIVLDRRGKVKAEKDKCPVKLRIFSRIHKKDKRYNISIHLTKQEFEIIWINPKNKKLRGKNKEIYLKLIEFEKRANDVADAMTFFDFAKFEMKLFRKSTDNNSLKYYFNLIINDKLKNNKIGTAESYKYTLGSLEDFSKTDNLTFNTITPEWLKEYESYMLANNKSYSTIAIYTRTLKAVYNKAIEQNDISNDIYPFGKNKYKIPNTKKVKKALNSQQLRVLFNAEVSNSNEQEAKDFWFFSYLCNGMNFKDIALLKYSDIKDDKFTYFRGKTFERSAEKTEITIYLTDFTNSVLKKYGNKKKNRYVFDILDIKQDAMTQYKKIKNFTRRVNHHIQKIAKGNELPLDLSTYWARHSFATNSLRKGASMEFISEALNHSDLRVTKGYFAGFEDKAKKEFANSLLDF